MSDKSKPVIAYIDTNILIEFRQLRDIKWQDVLKSTSAVLVISHRAFDELDKFKDRSGPSRTKRQRAAKTAKDLDAHLFGSDRKHNETTELQNGISLEYDDAPIPPEFFAEHRLDSTLNDHWLIAYALLAKSRNPGREVYFVSADSGARRGAFGRGLHVVTPPDELRVKDEPDPDQKELAELRKKVLAYESRAPKLSLRFKDSDRLEYALPKQRLIGEVEDHMEHYRHIYAHWQDRSTLERATDLAHYILSPPSKDAIAKYDADVDRFHEDIRKSLPALLEHHTRRDRFVEATIELWNDGSVPAEDVEIILLAPDGVDFARDLPKEPAYPSPPERPRRNSVFEFMNNLDAHYKQSYAVRSEFDEIIFNNHPRWKVTHHNKRASAKIAIGKLKHGQGDALPDIFLVLPEYESAGNFGLDYEVHADNSMKATGRLDVVLKKSDRPRRFVYFPSDKRDETEDDDI